MSAVANLLDHWFYAFSALTLLVGWTGRHPAYKNWVLVCVLVVVDDWSFAHTVEFHLHCLCLQCSDTVGWMTVLLSYDVEVVNSFGSCVDAPLFTHRQVSALAPKKRRQHLSLMQKSVANILLATFVATECRQHKKIHQHLSVTSHEK